MKYLLIIFTSISCIMLSGCLSGETSSELSQTISFPPYQLNIHTGYQLGNKDNIIDKRIVKKVLAIYQNSTSTLSNQYQDNIIISEDTLSPRASLEDYVQAGIGGIAYTRGKYESLNFKKGTLSCAGKEIPTITNSFSIYRTTPNQTPETLYFVQHFIHSDDKITTLSLSSLSEDTLSQFTDIISSISCR